MRSQSDLSRILTLAKTHLSQDGLSPEDHLPRIIEGLIRERIEEDLRSRFNGLSVQELQGILAELQPIQGGVGGRNPCPRIPSSPIFPSGSFCPQSELEGRTLRPGFAHLGISQSIDPDLIGFLSFAIPDCDIRIVRKDTQVYPWALYYGGALVKNWPSMPLPLEVRDDLIRLWEAQKVTRSTTSHHPETEVEKAERRLVAAAQKLRVPNQLSTDGFHKPSIGTASEDTKGTQPEDSVSASHNNQNSNSPVPTSGDPAGIKNSLPSDWVEETKRKMEADYQELRLKVMGDFPPVEPGTATSVLLGQEVPDAVAQGVAAEEGISDETDSTPPRLSQSQMKRYATQAPERFEHKKGPGGKMMLWDKVEKKWRKQ